MIAIIEANRTPIGCFLGGLSQMRATEMMSLCVKEIINSTQNSIKKIDHVILGQVLGAGVGQSPARQVVTSAGLSENTHAFCVNKVCGSGLEAIILGALHLQSHDGDFIIAGGMESMSQAPHLLQSLRKGVKFGEDKIIDHLLYDGLTDASNKHLMGELANETAKKFNISREMQDEWASRSVEKAKAASQAGILKKEMITSTPLQEDENIAKCKPEKLHLLKPAFGISSTITAGNASALADGAACVLMTRIDTARQYGIQPKAIIRGHSVFSTLSSDFAEAPIYAIKKLLHKLDWETADLFEINEAFALVTIISISELKLDPNRVNIFGGACAMGHPIGATGARMVVTMINALETQNLKRGIICACIGGGEAIALAIERQ